jgi:hypothetical protein
MKIYSVIATTGKSAQQAAQTPEKTFRLNCCCKKAALWYILPETILFVHARKTQ